MNTINTELWHLHGPRRAHHNRYDKEMKLVGINAFEAHKAGATGKDVKVAIIDSGCDADHPRLMNKIAAKSRSFEGYGAVSQTQGSNGWKKAIYNRYDAHGTALAGIVAGRPEAGRIASSQDPANGFDLAQDFTGVAPDAEVLVIRLFTNFDDDQLTKAIEAAEEADVVLFARTLPTRRSDTGKINGKTESPKIAADLEREKRAPSIRAFEDQLNSLTDKLPVVCAAGNGGFEKVSHPADHKNTIAVGACNELGWRSTYAQYGDDLAIVAPSSDQVIATREDKHTRLDQETASERKLNNSQKKNSNRVGYWGIVTTDNRGNSGYVKEPDPQPDFTPLEGKLRFGGTSAAAAQVAGVVALMISANDKLRREPDLIRKILCKTASLENLEQEVTGDRRKLTIDGEDHDFDIEFGFGLVDAAAAVAEAKKFTG